MKFAASLGLLATTVLLAPMVLGQKAHYPLGQILALTGSDREFTLGFYPGGVIALEHLQADGGFGYNFTIQELDTGGNQRKGIAAALALAGEPLTDKGPFPGALESMAIIGPLFSGEAAVVSYVAQQGGVLMISPSATSPNLSKKDLHPTFGRMLANDLSQGKALANVVNFFDWKSVAVIFTSDEYGQNLGTAFLDSCKELKIDVPFVRSFPKGYNGSQITSIVDDLQASKYRVVFLSMLESDVNTLYRALDDRGMLKAPYVYLAADSLVFSSIESLNDIAPGMIATGPIGRYDGAEYSRFENAFEAKYPDDQMAIGAPLMYDAVFVAAKTIATYLNISEACTLDSNYNVNCSLYTSTDSYDRGIALFHTLTNYVTHNGASGPFSVDEYGDRENARWGVYNPNGAAWGLVGTVGFSSGTANVNITESSIVWSSGFNGVRPYDQPQNETVFDGVQDNSPEFVFFAILTSLVEFFSIGLLIFNIVYYETPAVKVTSPRLNLIIIIGLMVMVSYLYIQPFQTNGSCQAKAAVITIGFSLLFGTLVVKIFRVFRIFKEAEKGKTITISDNKLMLFVGLLVSIDVLILLIWGLVGGARYEDRITEISLKDNDPNAFIQELHKDGYCTTSEVGFFIFFVVIKSLVMIAGIYFAVRSRHVSFKQLNDSRPVAFSIYSGSVTLIVLLFTLIYKEITSRATYSLVSAFFLIFVISTEVLLFGPRVYSVYTNEPFDLKDEAENETVVAGRKSATNRREQPPVINM